MAPWTRTTHIQICNHLDILTHIIQAKRRSAPVFDHVHILLINEIIDGCEPWQPAAFTQNASGQQEHNGTHTHTHTTHSQLNRIHSSSFRITRTHRDKM